MAIGKVSLARKIAAAANNSHPWVAVAVRAVEMSAAAHRRPVGLLIGS